MMVMMPKNLIMISTVTTTITQLHFNTTTFNNDINSYQNDTTTTIIPTPASSLFSNLPLLSPWEFVALHGGSEKLQQLIKDCLHFDASRRITSDEIIATTTTTSTNCGNFLDVESIQQSCTRFEKAK